MGVEQSTETLLVIPHLELGRCSEKRIEQMADGFFQTTQPFHASNFSVPLDSSSASATQKSDRLARIRLVKATL